jgi:hypothetical protein
MGEWLLGKRRESGGLIFEDSELQMKRIKSF